MDKPDDDLYKVLGVSKDASKAEIKKAWRKIALRTHPDRKNGNEAEYKAGQRAYLVLANPVTRLEYDQGTYDDNKQSNGPERLLSSVFAKLISTFLEGNPLNFVKTARKMLREVKANGEKAIKEQRRNQEKHAALMKRVRTPAGKPNQFKRILEQTIEASERRIAEIEKELADLEGALVLLDCYEDDYEPPASDPWHRPTKGHTWGGLRGATG